jgi:hypothetical protein
MEHEEALRWNRSQRGGGAEGNSPSHRQVAHREDEQLPPSPPRWAKGLGGGRLCVFLVLAFLVALPHLAEAGKCIQPPKGGTAFCNIDYQVYVAADTASNDTDYWFAQLAAPTVPSCSQRSRSSAQHGPLTPCLLHRFDLDNKAETLTEEWAQKMGCDPRSTARALSAQ